MNDTMHPPTKPATMSFKVDFGRKRAPTVEEAPFQRRVPRVARLMALAIKFDGLIRLGRVRDYAHLARLGRVTRARMTQVMNLLNLDPRIQEELLFLETTDRARDRITLKVLQPLAAEPSWAKQRAMWEKILKS